MLRLFLDGRLFWSAKISECPSDDYSIYDLKMEKNIEDVGQLTFTTLTIHPMFSEIRPKMATFVLAEAGKCIFLGKVSTVLKQFDYRVEVTVEEYFGLFKDDGYSMYYDWDYMVKSQRNALNTAKKVLKNIISIYQSNSIGGNEQECGVNSSWTGIPDIQLGYTNFIGEADDIHEFDLGGKSFYDVIYNEIITKCGGFIRMRVIGRLISGPPIRYELKRIYLDFLSTEADFRIDPTTGLMYEYSAVADDYTEIAITDGYIAPDPNPVSYDEWEEIPPEWYMIPEDIREVESSEEDVYEYLPGLNFIDFGNDPSSDVSAIEASTYLAFNGNNIYNPTDYSGAYDSNYERVLFDTNDNNIIGWIKHVILDPDDEEYVFGCSYNMEYAFTYSEAIPYIQNGLFSLYGVYTTTDVYTGEADPTLPVGDVISNAYIVLDDTIEVPLRTKFTPVKYNPDIKEFIPGEGRPNSIIKHYNLSIKYNVEAYNRIQIPNVRRIMLIFKRTNNQ